MSLAGTTGVGPAPPPLPLEIRWDGEVATIAIGGDVDHHSTPRLRSVAHAALAAGARSLVLECSEVPFMDSGGLALLVDLARRTAARDGEVTVVEARGIVRRVLHVTGVDQVVTLR